MAITLHCLALFNVFRIEDVKHWLEIGSYGMLFGLLVACGMGLPLPEDIPLITAGILVTQNHMNLAMAAVVGWLGIIAGDTVLYILGYRYGRAIIHVPFIGRHITLDRLHRAEALFTRYGVFVVAIGRMFALIRGAMVVTAGTTRFNYVKFIIADGISAIFSGGMFLALGIWCGHHLHKMGEVVSRFENWLLISAVVLALSLAFWIWWRNRKPRPSTPPHPLPKTPHPVAVSHADAK